MQNFYSHCIFCFNPLSAIDKKAKGEHVVPGHMYGSICVKDVCVDCNSDLGHSADHLAIEDSRIIAAAFALELSELQNRITDRGTGRIIDISDGFASPVKFKNGKPWVVPQRVSNELFVCDDEDAETHLLNILRKEPQDGLGDAEFESKVWNKLIHEYRWLKSGDSVSEPTLGIGLRKAQGKIQHELKITKGACERLVAKIGYETAFLLLEQDRLAAMPVLQQLAAVAMGQGRLDNQILMYPRQYSPVNSPPQGPKYHHQIVVSVKEIGIFIDIYFFGCVGFRLRLHGDGPIVYEPIPHSDGGLDMVSVLMTFVPGEEKGKYIFFRRDGSDKVEEHCVTGLI